MSKTQSLAVLMVSVAFPLTLQSSDNETTSLLLNCRSRIETEPGSGRWHSLTNPQAWKGSETAVVVCDMWDKHWCPASTERVGQMASRMNEVIKAARTRGALIIHCPSSTLEFYRDWPQRKLAQAAPKTATKIPLQNWCHLDKSVEGPNLPIDDSDGGCDCDEPVKSYTAWSRQHPAIEIAEPDAITDSAEAFYLMKQQGIKNVLVMGVHTNMCVLGRPFSIRQMVQQGQNVVLMRDMTDTMYNPKMAPFVSHFTGTDLVIEHIEQYWCPTVLSTDLIDGEEFRFSEDKRPHLVVLCAEREYETKTSLPEFAKTYLGLDFRVSYVWDDVADGNRLPGIEILQDADIALISVRRRTLPPSQLKFVRDFVAAGKPVVGIRTASHAFCLRGKESPEGLDSWPEFDRDVFGGNYTNHHGNGPRTAITFLPGNPAGTTIADLATSGLVGNGSLYMVSPLQSSAIPILTGVVPGKDPEPVAWLNRRKDGGMSFYTSLGHPDDFQQKSFNALLQRMIRMLANN